MKQTKILSKTRRDSVIAFGIVIIAYAAMQALSMTGNLSNTITGLLVPIYCGYAFRKRNILTPAAGIAGMVGGVVGCGLAQAFEDSLPPIFGIQMPYAIYGILASLICLLVACAVSRKNK